MPQSLTSNQITEEPSPIVLANPVDKRKHSIDVAACIVKGRPVLLDELCDGGLAFEERFRIDNFRDLFMWVELVEAHEMDHFLTNMLKCHICAQIELFGAAAAGVQYRKLRNRMIDALFAWFHI